MKEKIGFTKEEIKTFSDGKGNIDLVALFWHRFAEAKVKQNDKYMREGKWDLVEFL